MLIRKCDRCRKIYEENRFYHVEDGERIQVRKLTLSGPNDANEWSKHSIDLCENCLLDFENFMSKNT